MPAGATVEFPIRLYKIPSEIVNAALNFRTTILELHVTHDPITHSNCIGVFYLFVFGIESLKLFF